MCPLKTSRQVALVQVACNQRGRNASQLNIGGTGLGSFNNRFRDSLMGAAPLRPPVIRVMSPAYTHSPTPSPRSAQDPPALCGFVDSVIALHLMN